MTEADLQNWSPPWLTTKEGKPKAFDLREISEQEIAAAVAHKKRVEELAGSPLLQQMSEEDRFYQAALSNKRSLSANLAAFLNQQVTSRKAFRRNLSVIKTLREGLAKAHRDLGEWTEALAVITNDNGFAYKGFANLKQQILDWYMAVERPDDERCDCPPPMLEITNPVTQQTEQRAVQEAQFSIAGMCYSNLHGAVVKVNRCNCCFDLNAFAGVREELRGIERLRGQGLSVEQAREGFTDHHLTHANRK